MREGGRERDLEGEKHGVSISKRQRALALVHFPFDFSDLVDAGDFILLGAHKALYDPKTEGRGIQESSKKVPPARNASKVVSGNGKPPPRTEQRLESFFFFFRVYKTDKRTLYLPVLCSDNDDPRLLDASSVDLDDLKLQSTRKKKGQQFKIKKHKSKTLK